MEILTLNDDTLLQIFENIHLKFLLKIRLVCRRLFWIVDRICRKKKRFILCEDVYEGNYPRYSNKEKIARLIEYYFITYGSFVEEFFFLNFNKHSRLERNVKDFVARYELDEFLLENVVKYCPNLRVLDISKQIFDTYSSLAALEKLPQTIEILRIELCRLDEVGNVDETFGKILKTCTNLKEFSLHGSCYSYLELSDKIFEQIQSKNLTILNISGGFSMSITNLKWLKNVKNLIELHVERTDFGDEDLNELVINCFNLESLTLAYAKRVTNFGSLCFLKRLIYLKLDGNRDHFDDQALEKISTNCHNLTYLSLQNCRQLTNSSLISISNLHNLHYLDLCSIPNVDDKTLEWVCNYCINLEILQIKFCSHVTRQGLQFTAKLLHLSKLGCPFTGEELNRQQLSYKHFEITKG